MEIPEIQQELATSNRRMTEHLLTPEALRHHLDRLAQRAPEDPEAESEQRSFPVSFIQELPDFDRLAILGVYWGNLSPRSVARLTKCAVDTVLASLERSLKALRARVFPTPADDAEHAKDG